MDFDERLHKLLWSCTFPMLEKSFFSVGKDGARRYLQVDWIGHNSETGVKEGCKGRKWMLSEHMTDSEIVQTAFMATMAVMEHETREFFRYKGEAIFGPHYDVEALVELCEKRAHDVRDYVS